MHTRGQRGYPVDCVYGERVVYFISVVQLSVTLPLYHAAYNAGSLAGSLPNSNRADEGCMQFLA